MTNGSVKRKRSVRSFVVDLGPDPATGARRQARRSGFTMKQAITLDLYSHVAQGLDADAAELIASRT